MTARFLLLANTIAVALYIVWQGVEKFMVESFATWVISPVIYVRLCPDPFKYWLLNLTNSGPLASFVLCAVPVLMLTGAFCFGFVAYRKGSTPLALVSGLLLGTVFVVYHSVKHLGMTLEYI